MKAVPIFVLIYLIFLLLGCTSSQPIIPDNTYPVTTNSGYNPTDNRSLWGIWEISIDPISQESEIVPVRFGEFHANVRQFLELSPYKKFLKIIPPIVKKDYGFDVTISITHPFKDVSYYTGFDVRGIVIFDGTFLFPEGFYLTPRASDGDMALLNPDGYTNLFNAQEYTQAGIFGYSKGAMIPSDWPDPTNTLNAFKAFYSEGQSENEGGRRAFFSTDTVTRTYQINKPDSAPLRFWYAVDASWVPPTGDAPYDLSDFPPSANCPEPYKFDFSVVMGELHPDGGWVRLGLDIWDHQGWYDKPYQINISYQSPECIPDVYTWWSGPADYVDGERAHWELPVGCDGPLSPAAGAETLFYCYENPTDPFIGNVNGYGRYAIPVLPAGDVPKIFFIYPDYGYQGDLLQDIEIIGACFTDGGTVRLEKSGQPNIDPTNLFFFNSWKLDFDLDLTGAAVGLWDVVVENPGGQTAILPGGFEVLQ